jgi:hypothetical protein
LTAAGFIRPTISFAVILLAGCSSGVQGKPDTSPVQYGVFNGRLSLKGEFALSGSFGDTITSRQETCDAYVRGEAPATTLFVVPAPNTGVPLGGHLVSFTAGVPSGQPSSGYHGPGTYSEPSAIVTVLLIDNASFLPGSQASATIVIARDGSGSLTFSDMVDISTRAVESGTEQWRCSG